MPLCWERKSSGVNKVMPKGFSYAFENCSANLLSSLIDFHIWLLSEKKSEMHYILMNG